MKGFSPYYYPFLQEDKYTQHVDGLKRMLKQYHYCLGMLNQAEVSGFILNPFIVNNTL